MTSSQIRDLLPMLRIAPTVAVLSTLSATEVFLQSLQSAFSVYSAAFISRKLMFFDFISSLSHWPAVLVSGLPFTVADPPQPVKLASDVTRTDMHLCAWGHAVVFFGIFSIHHCRCSYERPTFNVIRPS